MTHEQALADHLAALVEHLEAAVREARVVIELLQAAESEKAPR